MNASTPISSPIVESIPPIPSDGDALFVGPPPAAPCDSAPEHLMPFGAAAKAIFVKANGLPAYRKSIRSVRCAE